MYVYHPCQISKIIQVGMRMLNFIPRIIQKYNSISNIKENRMVSIIIDSLCTTADSAIVCQIRKHYATIHLGNTHNTAIRLWKITKPLPRFVSQYPKCALILKAPAPTRRPVTSWNSAYASLVSLIKTTASVDKTIDITIWIKIIAGGFGLQSF